MHAFDEFSSHTLFVIFVTVSVLNGIETNDNAQVNKAPVDLRVIEYRSTFRP